MFDQPKEVQDAYRRYPEATEQIEDPQPEPMPDIEPEATPIDIKVMRILTWLTAQYPTLRQIWNANPSCPGCSRKNKGHKPPNSV